MSDDIVGSRLTAPDGPGNSRGTVQEIARLFLRLGVSAFGGPAAHVAVMEAEVVTRRGWMTRAEFLDHLGVVQLLPGPNSTELAIHVGHAQAGWRGAIVAGLCFVGPSALLVWLLSVLVSGPAVAPIVSSVLLWLTPVVVAVLVEALWKFGRQASERPAAWVVIPVTAIAAALLPSDLAVLVVGAVASMLAASGGKGIVRSVAVASMTLLGAGTVWAQLVPPAHSATPDALEIFLYFLRAGVSVFGSGYVLFAWLQKDLVGERGWLGLGALTQASALAQVTPGPLFTTATAAGFSIGGHIGALAATVGIFLPAFLSPLAGEPVRRLVQRSRLTRAALDGVVLASVALLGRAVVGFAWPMLPWQWPVCLLAAALVLLVRWSATMLLLGAASVGILAAVSHLFSS